MLDVGFTRGVGKQECGKMCDDVYVCERERTVSCGECGDGENGGIKPEQYVGKAYWDGGGSGIEREKRVVVAGNRALLWV